MTPRVEHAAAESRAALTDDAIAARVERRLSDLAAFPADAAYAESFGIDAHLEQSPAGRVLRNDGRHILVQIATVAEKLPQSFKDARPAVKDARPEVEWAQIGRLRT